MAPFPRQVFRVVIATGLVWMSAQISGPMGCRGWMRRIMLAVAAVLAVMLAHLGLLQVTGNRHEVIPGQLYRSAQPNADMLRQAARQGVRSVLNLRGASPGSDWYDTEVATAKQLGLEHRDFAMSASRGLDVQDVDALIALMRDLPKPILIHCKSGADRTGLAAALYLAALAGGSEWRAGMQLSLSYGHIGIPRLSAAWPMDETWQAAAARLGLPGR